MADGKGGARQQEPRPPSVAERNVMAIEAQTAELGAIRRLLEDQARDRRRAEPRPALAAIGQRMTWDGLDDTNSRSLRWVAFLGAYGGALMKQFARVPESYWTRETECVDGAEVVMAVVRCPCGTDTIVELGDAAECAGTQKSGEPCKRFYLYLRDRLFVANSPKKRVAPWEAIVDDYRSSRADS